jgi:hypothetical protein
VLWNLAWGRIIAPVCLNLRHRLRVAAQAEGLDAFSVYIEGHRLDRLQTNAGQFFRWRFLTRGRWWQAHPFSCRPPELRWLRLTVRRSAIANQLRFLNQGASLRRGPWGVTAAQGTRPRASHGGGIARSGRCSRIFLAAPLLSTEPAAKELIFKHELDWLARGPRRRRLVRPRLPA